MKQCFELRAQVFEYAIHKAHNIRSSYQSHQLQNFSQVSKNAEILFFHKPLTWKVFLLLLNFYDCFSSSKISKFRSVFFIERWDFYSVAWIQELKLRKLTPKHLLQSLVILCKMHDSLEVSASTEQRYTLIFHIIGLPIPFHF